MHQSAFPGHDTDVLPRTNTTGVGLNESLTTAQQAAVTDAVFEISAGREAIHYVCGILMLIYRMGQMPRSGYSGGDLRRAT